MAILQRALPYDLEAQRRLPGVSPLDPADWLLVDEAYGAQMAERERLIADRPGAVLALEPAAEQAAGELLEMVLAHLPSGFDRKAERAVRRPDGVVVQIDGTAPLRTLGHLVQEDFCLLQKQGEEHVMTGAVLCFPASWTLAEKLNRPLIGIHRPVQAYGADLAKRVQRLFDGLRPGRPLWRFNMLEYDDPVLFQPRPEASPRPGQGTAPSPVRPPRYLRSERQCLVRLPRTGAVVFSIHTFVLERGAPDGTAP